MPSMDLALREFVNWKEGVGICNELLGIRMLQDAGSEMSLLVHNIEIKM